MERRGGSSLNRPVASGLRSFPPAPFPAGRPAERRGDGRRCDVIAAQSDPLARSPRIIWPVQMTPVYPSGADGARCCTALLPGPGRALLCPFSFPWTAVRSQPLSVRQALLLTTHGPRLVLMPRFLPSPYARYAHTHKQTRVRTHKPALAHALA